MTRTVPADPLAALIREFELELMHVKQMLALAAEEQRDLVVGNVARLDAISAEKLVQLHGLELYAAQRSAYLAALGFATDASGLMACAAAAGRRGVKLIAAWEGVAGAISELHELSEQNATLLRARLAETQAPNLPAGRSGPLNR
jgi:hypothetical protein